MGRSLTQWTCHSGGLLGCFGAEVEHWFVAEHLHIQVAGGVVSVGLEQTVVYDFTLTVHGGLGGGPEAL